MTEKKNRKERRIEILLKLFKGHDEGKLTPNEILKIIKYIDQYDKDRKSKS